MTDDVHDLEPIETILPRVFAEITKAYLDGTEADLGRSTNVAPTPSEPDDA